MPTKQKPASGGLIKLRGRRWVVLPNRDEDILSVTPLGGSDKEATGIYLPLLSPSDEWEDDRFPDPSLSDLNDFATAKVLFDAARLSFRNAAGPFRCAGKLSFRPRSYQMVPLIMALKQDKVRLLIADDVGIGKTIEALLIVREMMERGEITSFAVVCPPHLCEQWNNEIHDKLGLASVVVRSSTVRALERQISNDKPVFAHFPYQVISIDYLKTSNRKPSFIAHCPGLVIVDEAHTCALPAGATSTKQQQRHDLLAEMIKGNSPHLLLLTATPHSGKNEEFSSLIGLLDFEFGKWDVENLTQQQRQRLARHFILRKRENIKHWLKQDTPFPERDSTELAYHLSPEYLQVFESARALARQLSDDGNETHLRGKYWAALALLRGVMSSPAAGSRMVGNKLQKNIAKAASEEASPALQLTVNPLIETAESQNDVEDTALLEEVYLNESQRKRLREMEAQLQTLHGVEHDTKAAAALKLVREWLKAGFHPIVFCHYKATADYLGEILSQGLGKKTNVRVLTSDLVDEQRREAVDELSLSPSRVLVATDCLSEGINLQEHFTAVLHYDLPWNPNRLEQREGRVDRYGQSAPVVRTSVLYGMDNPMDETVMEVLLRKVREIQRTTGVSITLGEENGSIMDAVLKKVLLAEPSSSNIQHRLDLGIEEGLISKEIETVKAKAVNLQSIFAHKSVNPTEIEAALLEMDKAIGDVQSVEHLVRFGVEHLGGKVVRKESGWEVSLANLPAHLRNEISGRDKVRVSFESPTPEGFIYLGRNHRFVDLLCQFLLALSVSSRGDYNPVARASVISTAEVSRRTVIYFLRLRSVVQESKTGQQNITEEVCLWGIEGSGADKKVLGNELCKKLLFEAQSDSGLLLPRQEQELGVYLNSLNEVQADIKQVAQERAEHQVQMHSQFSDLVGGKSYEAVHPVLPPDVLGVYLFLPKV